MSEILNQSLGAIFGAIITVAIVALFGLSAGATVTELERKQEKDRTDFLLDILLFAGLGTAFGWLFRKIMNLPEDDDSQDS